MVSCTCLSVSTRVKWTMINAQLDSLDSSTWFITIDQGPILIMHTTLICALWGNMTFSRFMAILLVNPENVQGEILVGFWWVMTLYCNWYATTIHLLSNLNLFFFYFPFFIVCWPITSGQSTTGKVSRTFLFFFLAAVSGEVLFQVEGIHWTLKLQRMIFHDMIEHGEWHCWKLRKPL